jgi:hypothetical protein
MGKFLLKKLLPVFLLFFCTNLFAAETGIFLPSCKLQIDHFISGFNLDDTTVNVSRHSIKICSCQVLDLQSTNHRHRNIALFAEKSNGRSLSYDMNRINRVMEKEKKHMQSFFYDKLVVLNSFTEHTDCRSLYIKLKSKNRYLILYDILDADIRR